MGDEVETKPVRDHNYIALESTYQEGAVVVTSGSADRVAPQSIVMDFWNPVSSVRCRHDAETVHFELVRRWLPKATRSI